jgi:hypothetical protein
MNKLREEFCKETNVAMGLDNVIDYVQWLEHKLNKQAINEQLILSGVGKCDSNSINNKNNIKIIDKINEAFKWLNEDLIYVAMIGIVDIDEEETGFYTKESIEEHTFNHWYEESKMISEDTATGTALIPLEGNMYMKFEFNS